MKILKTLKSTLKVIPTKLKVTFGVVLASSLLAGFVVAGISSVSAGYGPGRPVYDWNNTADRVGSLDGPVFNSFINTDVYGDERAFVDAKDATITAPGQFKDQVPVEMGHEYIVRLYVHNNANPSINGNGSTGKGVAKNTRVHINILPGLAKGQGITGEIDSDNGIDKDGNPLRQVYDTVDLRNEQTAFEVQYVPGSAKIENRAHTSGLALPDSIVTTGAPIGYDAMNGNLPGCFEFSAYVTIKVKVVAPQVRMEKSVRKAGDPAFAQSATVNVGDTAQWLINFGNNAPITLSHVAIKDQLPPHVQVIHNSVRWIYVGVNGKTEDVIQSDTDLFDGGPVDFGTWGQGGGFFLRFDTTALNDFSDCEADVVNSASVRADQIPNFITDTANLKIVKKNCQTATPSYSCDLFHVNSSDNRTVTVDKFNTTAVNGAIFKDVTVNWGDSSTPLITNNVVGKTHQFSADGSYVLTATARFSVNDQDKTSTNANCSQTVSFGPKVTVLPNTGAGDVAGVFVGTSAVGAFLHRMRTLRKLARK